MQLEILYKKLLIYLYRKTISLSDILTFISQNLTYERQGEQIQKWCLVSFHIFHAINFTR